MKVLILFYSMYGHVHRLAEAVAEGVRQVPGAEPVLRQVPELVPPEVLVKYGAAEAKKAFQHVPEAQMADLEEADAIIVGTPTRYGNMAGQMRNFLDQTGALWSRGAFEGKAAGVFTSTATQHGGQETTIISTMVNLLHYGMVIVGVPYSDKQIGQVKELSGGGPYGASTITGSDGARLPSEIELGIARAQGKRVAEISSALIKGRKG